jgi:tRNA(Arg) A34 adenosine deaminase TadA
MQENAKRKFMKEAVRLAGMNVESGNGGPFGAVIVRDNKIIASGYNRVTEINDPTAHAEVVAIRNACNELGTFDLSGCEIYTSCEPCPMCLGAILWARIDKLYYAADRLDARAAGFDDELFYSEISLPPEKRNLKSEELEKEEAVEIFRKWINSQNKIEY